MSTAGTKEELLSVTQAAERLGQITDRRVRKLCEEGRLGTRVGNRWIITVKEVEALRSELTANSRSPRGKEQS